MGYGDLETVPANGSSLEDADAESENFKIPLLTPFQLGPFKLHHRYLTGKRSELQFQFVLQLVLVFDRLYTTALAQDYKTSSLLIELVFRC